MKLTLIEAAVQDSVFRVNIVLHWCFDGPLVPVWPKAFLAPVNSNGQSLRNGIFFPVFRYDHKLFPLAAVVLLKPLPLQAHTWIKINAFCDLLCSKKSFLLTPLSSNQFSLQCAVKFQDSYPINFPLPVCQSYHGSPHYCWHVGERFWYVCFIPQPLTDKPMCAFGMGQ